MHKKVTKFMDGQATPREVHARYGIRKPCSKCKAPATNRIRVLAELAELQRRHPDFCILVASINPNGRFVPTVATRYGPMVMLHDLGSCDSCRKALEVQAAHGQEDWMLVEIDRGPAPINQQILTSRYGKSTAAI